VPVVAVDDVDLGLVRIEAATQPVRGHRAARRAAQDHDLLRTHDAPPLAIGRRPAGRSRRSILSTNSIPASIELRSGHERATFSRRSSCASLRSPPRWIAIWNRRGVQRLS